MGKSDNKNIEKKSNEESYENKNKVPVTDKPGKLTQEEMDEIDNSSQSKVMLIASLAKKLGLGLGSDLSQVEYPSAFIAPYSTLNFFTTNFSNNFNILLRANKIENEIDRLLEVFKYSTTVHIIPEDCMKVPLNAVVGETQCSNFHTQDLNDPNNIIKDNYYISEQVSEVPPNVATCVYNKKEGVKALFNHESKIVFQITNVKSPTTGKKCVRFEKLNEEYDIEFPVLHSRFMRGFVEYCGEGHVKSNKSKPYITTNFLAKPLIGGHYNSYEAKVYNGVDSKPIFKINGQWDGDSKITDCKTNETKPFFKKGSNVSNYTPDILNTDSTNVWKSIIQSVAEGKSINLAREKSKIIDYQKTLDWKPSQFFLNDQIGAWEPNLFQE
ncbi:hypothetical protein RB653_006823 [Dictyostelium firmibasis]|uniref:Oxysterol-binding protein n=1 Tax=Dictyostelium firmibasis TaxID=79012 RepID=A0AAN7YWX3_9MYCE